jgi:hypothetical protein
MADDHDALLARADSLVAALNREPQAWWDDEHCLDNGQAAVVLTDLAAELRALTSRHHTALNIIHQLTQGDDVDPDWDPADYGWTDPEERVVLNEAKDRDHD